jgi:hypothetical protein
MIGTNGEAPRPVGASFVLGRLPSRAKAGQHSAAIAALVAKAKLAGRWVERAEQKNANVNYVVSDQPMTEEEWAAERVTEH